MSSKKIDNALRADVASKLTHEQYQIIMICD